MNHKVAIVIANYNYGDYIEEALRDVHDEFCPDSEVLLPIAYLANEYIKKE